MGKPKMSQKELRVFTRQLASILKAGLSLVDTLELLERQMNVRAAPILHDLIEQIRSGLTFSEALSKHPRTFDETYIHMIRVGETGGILPEILDRVAGLLEYAEENRRRIRSALRYPKIVLGVMAMAFVGIILYIIPKFSSVFKTLGAELPLPTKILLSSYHLISGYWFIVLPVVGGGFILYQWWKKGPGKFTHDRLRLKFPVFGPLTLKSNLSIFARFFASLYRSGVPVTEVLNMSAHIVDNAVIARVIEDMKTRAIQGQPLTAALKANSVFPELAVQMIHVGESTGALSDMLDRLALYYESEVDNTLKNLSTLIEPFLIICLGAIVLLIALGVFLPMWSLMDAFKGRL